MADSGQGYSRPKEGFRFQFGGIKTNSVPDSLLPSKYAYAQNIRALRDSSVRTRWGQKSLFTTSVTDAITDLGSYAALGTDNLPRFLARNNLDQIFLDNGAYLGGLAGGGASPGASMIPIRPAESPTPWMYVANGSDYLKFSAPSATNVVTAQKVGIAEPQSPPDASGLSPNIVPLPGNPAYAHAGFAGAVSNTSRITDTVQSVFADPANSNGYCTIGVTAGQIYTRQMLIGVNGAGATVQQVYAAQPVPVGIFSIYYYTGTTGRCVIVPMGMGPGPGNDGTSAYVQNLLGTIARGALIELSGGSEVCYVRSVTVGPDGTIAFETSTTGTHTAAETFTCPQAVQISLGSAGISVGNAITAATVTFAISGIGISTQTSTTSIGSPFVLSNFSFQEDDYIHFSINIESLALLTECKLLFDVGDGSFTENFYYYTVRQSDVEDSTQNVLTQLGAAQLVSQRATIDEEQTAAANNQLSTSSSAQTTPGDGQWAEIVFPISALTRVGNDQTKSLQTVNAMQFLFNMQNYTTPTGPVTYPVTIQIAEPTIFGGYSPDVGDSGAPYLYRVRPRGSSTGVIGNPSAATRYGVNPRRAEVLITLPSAAYDMQIDTWDIFRYGGSVTSWRKIGQTASTATTFIDNYDDYAAEEGEELQFDNLQPWPSIDLPLNVTATSVTGTTALVAIAGATNALRYLPGNLVRIGAINVYTLWTRPTLVSGTTYLFQFVENAGSQTNVPLQIYEPAVAQQRLPYMVGPDAAGTVVGMGDPLRPGTASFCKNYAPDAAPDSYNIEISPPSEPLLGGETIDGLIYIASPEQWWALYPQTGNPLQRYSVIQQPINRGLAAPFGHCNDGKSLYWWAKDGIYSSSQGSLTDADLSNVFPHDGVVGANVTYNGHTVYAPDYSRAGTFRLTYNNNYLMAIYQDTTGTYRCLTLDMKRMAWSVDVYADIPSVFYHLPQQEGTVLGSTATYPSLVMGTIGGNVYTEADNTNDTGNTVPIAAVVCTFEFDGGDTRAGEQWGDLWLDSIPAAAGVALVATPMSLGAAAAAPSTIPTAATRQQTPVSVGGEILVDFLGLQLAWTDDYTKQSAATVLQIWQPSYIQKPETIADRYTDWYDGGTESAKYVQGFILHADTSNAVKGMQCRDGDTLALHAFTPSVQHNGESVRAYSFTTPFIAHTFRLEPTDQQPWRFFSIEWVFEPTPEVAETWQTQGTSFGNNGYSHIQRIVAAYAAAAPVTLTITSYDGQSPSAITLPSTGGAYQKKLVVLTFNKGQLYFFAASSSVPFQFYLDDWEVLVGNWSRQGAYLTWKSLGSGHGVKAAI